MASGSQLGGLSEGAVLADRYRLIRRLGSGGMAMVWLADDQRLDREVAVKIPSDVLADDRSFLRRFQREARIAAQLTHPNLVAVYDYSSAEERPFLVMQYVEGNTLDELRGRSPDPETLARELLSALDHIHAAGIVHRDVKPSNVLVTEDGRARLTDFGIAQAEGATRMTQTGQVIGSRGYMAPEVVRGHRATPRSDLYSAGMVLQDRIGPDDGRPLRRLVASLTSDDPGARPASAAEALEMLDEPAPDEPPTAAAPTVPRRARTAPPRGTRGPAVSRRALGALLAIALLVGFVAIVSGGGDDPSEDAVRAVQGTGTPTEQQTETASEQGGDPAEGARLNQEGFQLLQSGQAEAAVPVLERAVNEFPEGTSDINYAYALFNLGQALRLSGRPDEAIPILEQRLQFNNQRGEVQAELAKARQAAALD